RRRATAAFRAPSTAEGTGWCLPPRVGGLGAGWCCFDRVAWIRAWSRVLHDVDHGESRVVTRNAGPPEQPGGDEVFTARVRTVPPRERCSAVACRGSRMFAVLHSGPAVAEPSACCGGQLAAPRVPRDPSQQGVTMTHVTSLFVVITALSF